jgi:hypothetical protein
VQIRAFLAAVLVGLERNSAYDLTARAQQKGCLDAQGFFGVAIGGTIIPTFWPELPI